MPYRDLICGGSRHQDHHRGPTPREMEKDSFVMVEEVEVLRCLRSLPLLILLLLNGSLKRNEQEQEKKSITNNFI